MDIFLTELRIYRTASLNMINFVKQLGIYVYELHYVAEFVEMHYLGFSMHCMHSVSCRNCFIETVIM